MGFRRRWPGVSYGRGEDWHYVGDTGEPAFETGWDNALPDFNLAFRIRESGIVDIQGAIAPTSHPASTNTVFTLPEGYRPSAGFLCSVVGYTLASFPTIGSRVVPVIVSVGAAGALVIFDATTATYPVFGNTSQPLNDVYLNVQMFLDVPTAP